MNLLTIIGTRPQYIKIKPFYDYCKKNNITNIMVDTKQHYSSSMSSIFLKEFNIFIDHNLNIPNKNEIEFMSKAFLSLYDVISNEKPDWVVVIGDTNTTLLGALVSRKNNVKVAHIEAGIRCGDKNRPEEINRILVDELSDIHFVSRLKDKDNVSNSFFVGDMEYALLNQMEREGKVEEISYEDWLLMTIHRQENVIPNGLKEIFSFCQKINKKVIFPLHHRTKKVIDKNKIKIPRNIFIIDPLSYLDIISLLCRCKGVISDSGGIIKISPYFGKKCIIPLQAIEWTDVIIEGYAINELDIRWFDDYVLKRNRNLYYLKNGCQVLINNLYNFS